MPFVKNAVAALALGLMALPAIAQERSSTILVLDASGSMWGQIAGENKITIAREVVADILADFPADQDLGFVTYGHRERGQCSDIETMIVPAPGTASEIIRIVNGLNPRGMTPMTDAVISAAQALRHTEQTATVILVSDGIETCNPDPCAAARALARSGIDFTTHVIGFDVSGEADALMQMRCIAEETGGRFLTADNAQELSEALKQVVAAPAADSFTFSAHLGDGPVGDAPEGGAPVWDWQASSPHLQPMTGAVTWEISDTDQNLIAQGSDNPFTVELPFGEYVIAVRSEDHGFGSEVQNMFGPESLRAARVIFPPPMVEMRMIAVTGSPDGPPVETPVTWIFDGNGDSLERDGNPGIADLPPGEWQVRGYHTAEEREQSTTVTVIAGQPQSHVMVFDSSEPDLPAATLEAPGQVVVGSEFRVAWQAEGLDPSDYITIVPAEAAAGVYGFYSRVQANSEGTLRAPAEPGLYEVRLQTEGVGKVLAAIPVEATDAVVTLSAPDQVVIGANFPVTWTADGLNPRDYVTIVPVGADDGSYTNYHRIEGKTNGSLRAPSEPGLYEVRLQMEGSGRVLAVTAIEVVEAAVSVSAPDQVVVGSAFAVAWTAEGLNPRDYVTIVPVGADDGSYTNYYRIEGKADGSLRAPSEPGLYEVRLQMEGSGRVLAVTPVEVAEAEVSISGPSRVRAGGKISLSWTGSVHTADYITIVPAGTEDGKYAAFIRVQNASEGALTAPEETGLYEARYHLEHGNRVMARHPIEVLAADAALDDGAGLSAPTTATPGETITVSWSGGDVGHDQRVALARIDQADFSWISAASAADAKSLDLALPNSPGTYELRFLDLTDRKVLGRSIIEVQP